MSAPKATTSEFWSSPWKGWLDCLEHSHCLGLFPHICSGENIPFLQWTPKAAYGHVVRIPPATEVRAQTGNTPQDSDHSALKKHIAATSRMLLEFSKLAAFIDSLFRSNKIILRKWSHQKGLEHFFLTHMLLSKCWPTPTLLRKITDKLLKVMSFIRILFIRDNKTCHHGT